MGNTSPPASVRRSSTRRRSETSSGDRRRPTAELSDGIVTDYGVMRRSMAALVVRSDVTRALRSVDPMED